MLPQTEISTDPEPRGTTKMLSDQRFSISSTASTLCSDAEDERCFSNESHSGLEGMANRFMGLLSSDIPKGQTLAPLIIRCMNLLMSCGYDHLDISSVLAVTVIHHNSLTDRLSKTTMLSEKERSFIILAQVFISHSIVLDECVVLSNWHKYLFSSYCDMNCLKRAIARILKRMEYTLSVDPDRVSDLAHVILNFS